MTHGSDLSTQAQAPRRSAACPSWWAWLTTALIPYLLGIRLVIAADAPRLETEPPQTVTVRGKLICLPEHFHRRYETELAVEHEHILGFLTLDAQVFTLLRTKFSESLFIDPELRDRELQLKGRVFPKSHVLEVTRTWSIRDGAVHDLFYYCTICSIESVSAGPCACCQGSVELRETPLRTD